MPFTITPGYTFNANEKISPAKLNLANAGSVSLDGQTYSFGAGTSVLPSINFSGDTGTGFYSIGAGSVGLTGSLTASSFVKTTNALVVDTGTGALPALAPTDRNIMMYGGTGPTMLQVSFGGNSQQDSLLLGGSRSTPAATPDAARMRYALDLWDGVAGSSYPSAIFDLRSDGLQSSTNHGGVFVWASTPNGGTSLSDWMWLKSGWLRLFPFTAPASNPASGVYLYCDSADNKLKVRGSSGTVTILAIP